ncbi:transposable element Tcb1 transposase [Trichonephila clavipes]|nr:transposable element Tcb1 transposase [Trichonephila clavipes]
MLRGRHRASFDQVSEFDRRRIISYSDCGLFFREISQHVGRNQATVLWVCHRWMQEETTDRQGRSHSPHCDTARDDRRIVRMEVMDRAATSRIIAQQIQSVTHHLVSARTIRHHLHQSRMIIELLSWSACSPDISPIENVWSILAHRLSRDAPSAATLDLFWQYVEAACIAVPQGYNQSLFDSIPRHVAAVIANNNRCTN